MSRRFVLSFLIVAVVLQAASAAAQCITRPVTCGTTRTDTLAPSSTCVIDSFPSLRYSFNGTAGQKLTLIASNLSGLTIGMTLLDSTGGFITSSFDEPAQILTTLPATGQYFVEINFGNPNNSGAITLEVKCETGTTPVPTECTYSGAILIGQSITSQLTSADTPCGNSTTYAKAYRVPVFAGEAFTVNYSANYPVEITVAGPDASGAFRSSASNALETAYVAPATGNVTIFVMSNTTSPRTGTFTLTLTPLTLPSCGKTRAVRH